MSIKLTLESGAILEKFEIDVILDEYQTLLLLDQAEGRFEIDVILDEYQTD